MRVTGKLFYKNYAPARGVEWAPARAVRTFVLLLALPIVFSGCIKVKPMPLTEQEHLDRAETDRLEIAFNQHPPAGSISLPEAIARTLKYNLDHQLAQMEAAFSLDQLDAANMQMLPRIAANAGYSMRDSESASSSISYETRRESLEPSFSTEKIRFNTDISFSWSLLDFGLGYFQAKQQADRYLILQERRRRITNNLVKEVISAYFRVASLERIRPRVEEAIVDAEDALEMLRRLEESKTAPLAQTLERQRSLIVVIGQLKQLSADMVIARTRLASLMNLPLGSGFELADNGNDDFAPPELTVGLDELERLGAYLRPDLREDAYTARIDAAEAKKELLRMFPGVTVFGNGNFDSNKYLLHQTWAEAGSRMTFDILGLAGRIKQYNAAKTKIEVARIRRHANTIAALVQINMSYHQYRQALDVYADAQRLSRIDARLATLGAAHESARAAGRLERIVQSVTSVTSQLDTDRRMVEVLSAWANLYFSVGGDIIDGVSENEDLDAITMAADESLHRWLSGEFPSLPVRHTPPTPATEGNRRAAEIMRR